MHVTHGPSSRLHGLISYRRARLPTKRPVIKNLTRRIPWSKLAPSNPRGKSGPPLLVAGCCCTGELGLFASQAWDPVVPSLPGFRPEHYRLWLCPILCLFSGFGESRTRPSSTSRRCHVENRPLRRLRAVPPTFPPPPFPSEQLPVHISASAFSAHRRQFPPRRLGWGPRL